METKHKDIQTKLITMRDELTQRLSQIEHDRRHVDGPLDADSGERAVEMENDDVLDALDASIINELKAVNKAIARIESGNYGTCSGCGEDIAPQRLEAIPFADLCVNCASSQES